MEPEIDPGMRDTIDSDRRDVDGDVAPNDMQDAVGAAVDAMGEILLSPPPTPVQDAVLPTVCNDESSDDEDPTTWDQHRLYAAAEEAMRKNEYWMGASNFFVKVPDCCLPFCRLMPTHAQMRLACTRKDSRASLHSWRRGRGGGGSGVRVERV